MLSELLLSLGAALKMKSLHPREDLIKETTEDLPEIVSILLANAVATFDADPSTSRSYLVRASAILQAFAAQDTEQSPKPNSRGGLALWQLNRVIDYIEQHLAEKISGEDLASLINVSVGQLFRAFKASVGIPPLHYVVSRRLEFACSLLRSTQEPLSQVALSTGFCDQAHLSRVFRRLLGVTPAVWRRDNARDPANDVQVRPLVRSTSPEDRVHGRGSDPTRLLMRSAGSDNFERVLLDQPRAVVY